MIAVSVTIPEIQAVRRFCSPDDAHLAATLAKPCYGDPATRTVEITEINPAAERIAAAWKAADDFARAGMDDNGRHTVDLLLAQNTLSPLPPQQLALIVQYGGWWSAVWNHYGEVRARITAGQDARFDPLVPGPCPTTIWDIAGAQDLPPTE